MQIDFIGINTFKKVYYPSVKRKQKDKEINKILSRGWRLIHIAMNHDNSAYMYFVHEKTIEKFEEVAE